MTSELIQHYLQTLELGPRKPDFDLLCAMTQRHVATFPFSSVNCRLGIELPLDFESLFRRIVVEQRGGYCFEHNGLFYQVLQELGYTPQLYLARVIYDRNTHPGLTHRISVIRSREQNYLVDVGFGPMGPRLPIPFCAEQTCDGDRVFRVKEKRAGEYHLQIFKGGDFFSLYRFELARYGQTDCELGHFYSHRHPDAAFVNNLVVSRLLADEIRSLRNLEYWIIKDGDEQSTQIKDAEQLTQILVDDFDIRVSDNEGKQLFEQLCF